jgi:hypothetical protein
MKYCWRKKKVAARIRTMEQFLTRWLFLLLIFKKLCVCATEEINREKKNHNDRYTSVVGVV